MPNQTREQAEQKARELKMPIKQVVKGVAGYFIAPLGVESKQGKNAYASCRSEGGSKEKCAKIAHSIEKKYND